MLKGGIQDDIRQDCQGSMQKPRAKCIPKAALIYATLSGAWAQPAVLWFKVTCSGADKTP